MSNVSFSGVTQFKSRYIDQLHNLAEGTLLDPTVGLCHHCHSHVPAWRYHKANQVFIIKHCVIHGISHHMIESDYEFYQ